MMAKKIWEESSGYIKHIPSGQEAWLQQRDDSIGAVRGYFTQDSFVGTSIAMAKKVMVQIFNMGR